ncbi:MAG: serine hydroxymethyltransferase [Candidatus Thermoplasmatota archaeon]
MYAIAVDVKNCVKDHHKFFRDSLPMIASENLISPLAKEMLLSDFGDRYAEGLPGARYYQGCKYIDIVESKCIELAKKLFNARYADVRPISGTVANLGVLFALTKPGDTISTVAVPHGAHISSEKFGAVGVRGLNRVEYPFDFKNMNIDIEGTKKLIKETKPKLCLFGQSVFLFPTPIKEVLPAIDEIGALVVYDAAHVLGLIGGGKFQDPLREGADVITGSTHKTLPGPQHGIVLAEGKNRGMEVERLERKLNYGVFPGVVSNHHLHCVAALTITLAEHIKFGKEYASQIIANAKALGESMYELGFDVLCPHLGFTESHTLAIDVSKHGGGSLVVENLEKANIVANKNLLPWDAVNKAMEPSGIRLGLQELTRIGMGKSEMNYIADLFKKIIIDRKKPEEIKNEVIELRKKFKYIHYCFGAEKKIEAHKYNELIDNV